MNTLTSFATTLHEKLTTLQHVALIAHRAPDGDAYGSLEGMSQLLMTNYPHLTVSIVIPLEKQVDSHAVWIVSSAVFPTVPADSQLVLFLDASPLSRTALTPSEYPLQPVITIDHHEPRSDSIEGYRDVTAASTTIIITDIARELHWQMSSQAATALLLGVYTDTGGFIHRNPNQRAFETAAFLLSQ